MSITVLNVAEKPSVAKAIAETLGKSPNKVCVLRLDLNLPEEGSVPIQSCVGF